MNGIIDFHSHVLPGMDDGSSSLEESIALLGLEAEQGIHHVVATPHFYPRYVDPGAFLQKREASQKALQDAMKKKGNFPEIYMGAEVYFFRGISESEFLPQLTIQGKKCILIEMPPSPWPEFVYRELEAVWRRRGIIPVVAHIDRYIAPFRTHKIPHRLQQMPVLVQANAGFFLDNRTRRMALKMLWTDQIQLLGSDCHNLNSRPPRLGSAVKLIRNQLGDEVLARIQTYQEEVL